MSGRSMDAAAAVLAGRHVNQSAAADHYGVSRQAVSRALQRLAVRAAKPAKEKGATRRWRPPAST